VVADFVGAVERLYDRPPGSLKRDGLYSLHRELGLTHDELGERIRDESAYRMFCLTVPALPWTGNVARLFNFSDSAYVLTSPWLEDPTGMADKVRWAALHLEAPAAHVITFTEKHLLAGPHRYLIDDRPHNIRDWETHGGTGILFPAPHHGRSTPAQLADPMSYLHTMLRFHLPKHF